MDFRPTYLSSETPPEATVRLISKFQTAKGTTFVLVTAGLLYVLIRAAVREIHESQAATQRSEDSFRRLVQHSPSGIFVHIRGRFDTSTKQWRRSWVTTTPKR